MSSCLTSVSDDILCFQYMLAFHILQHGHLLDRYFVEFLEAFSLWQTFVNEYCIQVLHITQTNQLIYCCVIADIAFILRMCVAPLFGGHSKQCHIEHICFVGINKRAMVRVTLELLN